MEHRTHVLSIAPFIAAQIKGIVGVMITITRIEGKWKVSQNRQAADRAGVHAGLRAVDADAMAGLVAQYGEQDPNGLR